MKKFLVLFISLCLMGNVYSAQWRGSGSDETLLGATPVSDIDTESYDEITDPLTRLLDDYREGCTVTYASTSSVDISAGQVILENAAGTAWLMQEDSAKSGVSTLDTGSLSASSTYYVYVYQNTATTTTYTGVISANSTAPVGTYTYFRRLASFETNSDSEIIVGSISNDNDSYGIGFGDWVSGKSHDTSYEALTDGIVCAYYSSGSSNPTVKGYTDENDPPTTLVAINAASSETSYRRSASVTFPVKRGDYWKVTDKDVTVDDILWLPLE